MLPKRLRFAWAGSPAVSIVFALRTRLVQRASWGEREFAFACLGSIF